jgi:YbbR domain-containing protein
MIDFFRQFLAHNFGLKLISVVLAAGLWLAVSRDEQAEVPVEVPIEFRNIPENLQISSEHIPEAQIRLRGPERLIRRVQPSDVHLDVDLAGSKPGERTFDLTAEQVHQPFGVQVMLVVPTQLHLSFDTELQRRVEVRPRVVGQFATGYSIDRVIALPPTISISGPRRRVEAVEAAITDPVDVSGIMQRGIFVTHAYVSDPMVQVIGPTSIRVNVIMKQTPSSTPAP